MLKNLWKWWIEGLIALWPDSVRRWCLGQRRRIWAGDVECGFEFNIPGLPEPLWRDSKQQEIPAAVRRRLRASDIVIRLPESCALKRVVTIPSEIPPLTYIRQRLDELSPFPGNQTCFDVVDGNGSPGTTLVVAHKSEIDKRVSRLNDIGLDARAVTVEGFEQTPLDLLSSKRKPPARRDPLGGITLVAGLASCAAAVAIPFVEQSRLLEELNGTKTALERNLRLGDDTRIEIEHLQSRAAAIVDHRTSRPDVVTLLAEVTGSVPDHSWVRQLVVHGDELTLQGESEDTADLIARLEASPRLRNVRYETAITRDAGSGKDRFNLKAETQSHGSGEANQGSNQEVNRDS